MRYLVLGGGGFLGLHLVRRLVTDKHEVIAQSLAKIDPATLRRLNTVKWMDLVKIKDEPPQVDAVFNVSKILVGNLVGVLGRLAEAGCKHFVFSSCLDVYGNSPTPFREDTPVDPLDERGRRLLRVERAFRIFAKNRSVNCTGLRLGSLYGVGESEKSRSKSLVRTAISAASSGGRLTIPWDGSYTRDWLYVTDAINPLLAATKLEGFNLINVAPGRGYAHHEMLEIIGQSVKNPYRLMYTPLRKDYQLAAECDPTIARDLLGFRPQFDLVGGIEEFVRKWD